MWTVILGWITSFSFSKLFSFLNPLKTSNIGKWVAWGTVAAIVCLLCYNFFIKPKFDSIDKKLQIAQVINNNTTMERKEKHFISLNLL